jgi:hypothetical protein
LPVTPAAGVGHILVTHWRFGIAGSKHFVCATMAVLTTRCRRTGLARNAMHTVRVSILRVGVAVSTAHLGRSRFMRKALYILVAVNTGEHAAMDRVLQLALVHKETELLAIQIFCQSLIGMAGEAVSVLELLPGACCGGPNQKQ